MLSSRRETRRVGGAETIGPGVKGVPPVPVFEYPLPPPRSGFAERGSVSYSRWGRYAA